ncbi:GyrI-like domain-containing protein [Aquamicrobium sp. LC103]|uniref:GyrI-like domain-containing protein n=1 Tax=Aquamicrobium sp. LC103 TaxID=1120658 RepID=UPI00063E7D79|nr:GyrI-like domain-containing protein [Aquamicrobium sp. LC103]
MCGDVSAARHGFGLSERPAQVLTGLTWEGTYEAAAGALHSMIERVKAYSDAQPGVWKSPIVGISWNDRPEGFRYFAGVSAGEGEMSPAEEADGFGRISLPEMRFASSWHGPRDGDVVPHYGRMIEWMREEGLARDASLMHQREEYPHDIDLTLPPTLRIMMPVKG